MRHRPEQEADLLFYKVARLIATNEDLLAALENIATWLIAPDMDAAQEMRATARAAIAKAKGE